MISGRKGGEEAYWEIDSRSMSDGKEHYSEANGKDATGRRTIAGKKYHFTTAGVMDTGRQTINSSKYHFASSDAMDTGFKTIAGEKYYFIDSRCAGYKEEDLGIMVTGTKKISGKTCRFNDSGVMQ